MSDAIPSAPSSSLAPCPAMAKSAALPPQPRSSKSKKKKGSGANGQGENTGRWTAEEHRLFLQGLEQHGKGWKKIASLIKSRTVVQIRTHAQKYFQKLAKARQNGEEGEVTMEGRGGLSTTGGNSITGVGMVGVVGGAHAAKRRRPPLAGTKRKAISAVVHSAHKQGKKMAVGTGKPAPLPAVAPALANFVVPVVPRDYKNGSAGAFAGQGSMPATALEDSIFRFLTPAPVATTDSPVLNEIARQAGANPITLPGENATNAANETGGEVSPTGVADISIYPSWTDAKDPPSWYAKGADVDALLDVAGTLDWLADTGDLHENFNPPATETSPDVPELDVSPSKIQAKIEEEEAAAAAGRDHEHAHPTDEEEYVQEPQLDPETHTEPDNHHHHHATTELEDNHQEPHLTTISSSAELPQTMDDSNMEQVVPPLPSIFDGAPEGAEHYHDDDPEVREALEGTTEPHESADVPATTSASDLLLTSNPSSAKLTLKDDDGHHHHGDGDEHHPASTTAVGHVDDAHHSVDGELGDATLFDTEMEQDFVSTILENSESAVDLAALHD